MTSSILPSPLNNSPKAGKSKFKEHLSILIPPHHLPITASKFSPESPPPPSRTLSTWTASSTMRSPATKHTDLEAGPRTSPHSASSNAGHPTLRDQFTKLWFDVRTFGREPEPELVPIQPALPPWAPLHVEKRAQAGCCMDCPCRKEQEKKKKRKGSLRDKILIHVLIWIILYLLGDSIFLNIRVVNMASSTSSTPSPVPTNSTSNVLSADAQSCLSQYNVNAPSNPSGYPCSSCLPVLQGVPSNFSDGNAQDVQQIQNAVQFCSLRSIFDTADNDGQTSLKSGNWVNDVKFCAWTGISCDGSGRVSSL